MALGIPHPNRNKHHSIWSWLKMGLAIPKFSKGELEVWIFRTARGSELRDGEDSPLPAATHG